MGSLARKALMNLMNSAEVCFGDKVTLRLGCFASGVEDSSRKLRQLRVFSGFLHVT